MSEQLDVIGILKKTEYAGYTIQPYLYIPDDAPYITVQERLTSFNLYNFSTLPANALEMYNLSNDIEPKELVTRFAKKPQSIKAFFEQKGNAIAEVVKPYIEAKLVEIIELIARNNIPLYEVSGLPNLYDDDRIYLEKEKASTLLRFDRTEEGTIYRMEATMQHHEINLLFPSNIILTNQPCYFISNKRLIGFDKNISGKMLTPFLQKESIVIPKRFENKYFDTFIKKIVNESEIFANGFQIKNAQLKPKAKVLFDIDWKGNACLILQFVYGEKSILASNPRDTFTDLTSNEQGFIFHRYKRDLKWENEHKKALEKLGLNCYNDSCYRLPEITSSNQTYEMVQWIIDNEYKLFEIGLKLNKESIDKYTFSKPDLVIKSELYNDYFDVYMVVKIDKFEIPFIRFKHNILTNNREYLLPSGKIFIIPLTWLEQYRDLLIHSQEVNKSLRLKKHHYKIIDKLDDNIHSVVELDYSEELVPLPVLYNVTLRPYQLAGYHWMHRLGQQDFGGILADDMGLGKTLQTIALLAYFYSRDIDISALTSLVEAKGLSAFHNSSDPQLDILSVPEEETIGIEPLTRDKHPVSEPLPCSLVVMPTSLIHNWINEINKFAPYLKVLVYTGASRSITKNTFTKFNIVLTTYGTLRNDIEILSNYTFAYTILDESQQVKNPASKTAKAVFEIKSNYRFALTGTPVENSLTDLWSQMNFVNPGLLGSLEVFNSFYAAPLAKDPDGNQAKKLLDIIEPFVLRRTKESVAPELPILSQTVSYCSMTDSQSELYESEKSKVRNLVLEQLESGNVSGTPVMVLKALMKLRQIANHPVMVDPDTNIDSGKYDEVTDKLDTIIAENHRVLIFSSFVKHLSIFEDYCKSKGYNFALLTGSTTNRGKVVTEFKMNKEVKIFLISLKAGGLGLNLTEADYVFVLDPWWNPASEMQAINRAHRIGQHKNVFVYRFITKDTVEEKIMTLQEKKQALADAFIKPEMAIASLSNDEIRQLFE